MPGFNGSDIERIDRADIGDNRKVQGRRAVRNVDSSVPVQAEKRDERDAGRPRETREGGRGWKLKLYRDTRIGDEAVCCAREFTAEIPLTD